MNFSSARPELTECDREKIHNIAAVQPFGGLIALNADWFVSHRSLNCADLLGLEENPEIGQEISAYLQPHALEKLREALGRMVQIDQVERLFGLRLTQGGELFDVAVHTNRGSIIIEFEPHAEADYSNHLSMIGPALSRLEGQKDITSMSENAAVIARELLGYDRVMVYRFHPDQSGEVIAEDRREDLEPYLGLRYPQADIPQQARELFRRNKVRVISDMNAAAVPIQPEMGLDGEPLDLSMSILRAHSQMHLEYMRNMGVHASLAISIVVQDRLWGMISCHHYAPKLPAYSLRTVAETFSQMFSLMIGRTLIEEAEQVRERGRTLHDQLMVKIAGGTSLSNNLPLLDQLLENVIPHEGSSVWIDGTYRSRGTAPTEEEFTALLPALNSAPISTIITTHMLGEQVPAAKPFADRVAGAMILPISRTPRDFLVLWRKPLTQTVTWAGDPSLAKAQEGERLTPRGSFAAWQETVSGRSPEWTEQEEQIAESLRVTLLEVVLRMSDEVARERTRAQEQQELLIAELNHRVRNILNLIRSLVNQSQHDASSVVDFSKIIGGRINALACAHDNITRENWAPAPLAALFETELEAYLHQKKERMTLTGPEVLIRPEAYTVLALVVHELVTNSAKYGALCDSHGSLRIDVERMRDGNLKIEWVERGGPPVKPPTRRGFGSTIIERSIPYELKGEAALKFKLPGLEASFMIPARYIAEIEETDASQAPNQESEAKELEAQTSTLPEHVLVVEDSMIIALDTEESLKRLGIHKVSVTSSVAGALEAIKTQRPDFAILDYNLGTESSVPVASALSEAGVPFVLATGYGDMENQLDEIGAQAVLRKPYGRNEISTILGVDT